ncbi:MAG: hypothetical protein HY815_31225 [Candidatus Riflebacteria bacterium]|nr:hypothetical protein [Candidatus Riflebacteria bacterium]
MTRAQLEHIIRAASAIADDRELIVIGSQSILGQFPDPPAELCVSMEADVYPRNVPERWDLIDGSIGEGSPFHEMYGYYAQGVGEETAILPSGWKDRLIPISNENTRGATGWTLEVHDLVASKYAAGREKDRDFVCAAIRHGLVNAQVLDRRIRDLPLAPDRRDRLLEVMSGDLRRGGQLI